jgi:putative endonuclease
MGADGEEKAAVYLKANGYQILARNFRNRLGEIDIVAREKDVICFVEVRTRRASGSHEEALRSIDAAKQYKLSQMALLFLKERDLLEKKARFDVVSVSWNDEKSDCLLVKDAFCVCERYS